MPPAGRCGDSLKTALSGRTRARDIQILSLRVCPRLVRHAQLLSSHIVDMADMGSLQLQKDHAGYGSQADSGLPLVPGIAAQHLLW